jgi:hypothetical protein
LSIFSYTRHADEMIADRQIEKHWVERTILKPDVVETDPKHPERMRAFRAVPERDGRVLRVVYVARSDGYRIVTLFLDRGRRRQR